MRITRPGGYEGRKDNKMKMLNQEMRTVTMSRSDMLRVGQALTSIVIDYEMEIEDPSTTDSRRNVCKSSLEMWERIRNEFDRQMDEQDPEEFLLK